jgi:hypothetical protein
MTLPIVGWAEFPSQARTTAADGNEILRLGIAHLRIAQIGNMAGGDHDSASRPDVFAQAKLQRCCEELVRTQDVRTLVEKLGLH